MARHYHLVVAKDPSGETDDYIALITLGAPGDRNIVVSCLSGLTHLGYLKRIQRGSYTLTKGDTQ